VHRAVKRLLLKLMSVVVILVFSMPTTFRPDFPEVFVGKPLVIIRFGGMLKPQLANAGPLREN